jgi:hypothetical protein
MTAPIWCSHVCDRLNVAIDDYRPKHKENHCEAAKINLIILALDERGPNNMNALDEEKENGTLREGIQY